MPEEWAGARTEVLRGSRVIVEAVLPGEGRLWRAKDGAVAGSLVLRDEGEALVVERLCIEPALRGYGLGTETARLLRGLAEHGPWAVLRAWAPPDLGLAVYFWCRMGLRPLHGEGPDGGIWFERRVGQPQSV